MAIVVTTFICCITPGQTTQSLTGNEQNLPEELKGLKVYTVAVSEASTMKIAVLKNQVIATQEVNGKDVNDVVIINEGTSGNKRVIEVSEIVSENDDIIVCRKIKK